ncbi:MAG: ComEC/Rec2 family competence protein [Dongiaceae bacterium]
MAERDRWLLWLPVALGGGIACYFALPVEPAWWLVPAALPPALLAAWLLRRWPLAPLPALALAAALVGLGAGQLRTALVAAPMLPARLAAVEVTGRVAEIQPLPSGQRLVLVEPGIAGLAAELTPARLRVRLARPPDGLQLGQKLRLRASLGPPSPPSVPGTYDFQRDAFFDGIGAVGFAFAAEAVGPPGHAAPMTRLRQAINARILAALPGESGPVAVALVTGDQAGIAKDVLQAMRDSGLAHLLSISGLHMAIVAGFVFVGLRGLLALVPRLALHHPIKKWAALAALAAAFVYLLLAGGGVPPQRSFLMTAMVLLAVLAERNPLSMRLVAMAAVAVLLTTPEALTGPSFQMSFAAVVALITAYETAAVRRWSRSEGGWAGRTLRHVAGLLLTSLIATVATAPFAVYHFNRLAAYGIAANLLAVPLTSFWVMPWAVVGLLLMPLGLERLALLPMGWGIDGVDWIARTVAAWPGAVTLVPAMPLWGLVLASLGGLWLCLWRRPWRLAGLPVILLGLAGVLAVQPPDLLVGDDGKLMALRDASGRLLLSTARAGRFDAELWLRQAGQEETVDWDAAADGDALSCDPQGCLYRKAGHVVALVRDPTALREDCRVADLVVSPADPVRRRCPSAARVIDRFDLWRYGGHAVWLEPGRLIVLSVRESRGERPWVVKPLPRSRLLPAGAEEGAGPSSGAAARPADPAP